jgi:hypothetical protein
MGRLPLVLSCTAQHLSDNLTVAAIYDPRLYVSWMMSASALGRQPVKVHRTDYYVCRISLTICTALVRRELFAVVGFCT